MKIKLFTIPNLLTLSNLLCGMIATVAILTDGDLHLAFWLLVLAAVFDFFDGFTARLLHQSSPIGLQLDSLADMVSSGVAPTAVMLTLAWQAGSSWWAADTGGPWSWIVLLLAVGTALRLAKFNIDDTQRTEFCGLPSPRRDSSAPRWVCSTPKECSRCPMKPYCSPRRRRPGS